MTVSYQYDVASSTSGGFTRLLFKWRGSVYKLVYRELLLFSIGYAALSFTYRIVLNGSQKKIFELCVAYCATFTSFIPLSFVLGFYVTFVAARWWNQYLAIPWPDKLMHAVALYIGASDDTSRMMRRSLMRYANLTLVLVLRSISMAVKKRFPTKEHLVEAGYMTKTEVEMIRSVPSVAEYNTYWIPCTWFVNLLRDAKRGHQVSDNQGIKLIMEELNDFRAKCGMLWSYDWVSIPLVYTQVVTLATYSFFAVSVVGRQYVNGSMEGTPSKNLPNESVIDCYIPVFTILQFLFYMGLLKVAEQLINPFGDDDEDFELNWIIDRHITVSYLGVDLLNGHPPPLIKDQYFHDADIQLPYTEAAVAYKRKTYRGSVHTMQVPQEQQHLVLPDITEEEDEDVIAESYNMGTRRASVWTIIGGKINAKFSSESSVCLAEDMINGNCDNSEPTTLNESETGSRRISDNSLLIDNKNFRTASDEGIRGNSGAFLTDSCEEISETFQVDDDLSIGSRSSFRSIDVKDTIMPVGQKKVFNHGIRSSNDSDRVPMFYKSAQTLHPSTNAGSRMTPAVSFTKLKGTRKPRKDLWNKINIARNLSWGRKPSSKPWISIAGRNERPFVQKRNSKLYETSSEESLINELEQGVVSITVECPSDPNIADEPDEIPKESRDTKTDVRKEEPMCKQQSLDETNNKDDQIQMAYAKSSTIHQSLPALEQVQVKKQNSQDTGRKVRWRSDDIEYSLKLRKEVPAIVPTNSNRRKSLKRQENLQSFSRRQGSDSSLNKPVLKIKGSDDV